MNKPTDEQPELGSAPSPEHVIDEAALAEFFEKGRIAWKDVPDAAKWVAELRGHQEEQYPQCSQRPPHICRTPPHICPPHIRPLVRDKWG